MLEATKTMPCPYHDTPIRCAVCGASCHGGAKGVRCRIDHDDAKHTPVPVVVPLVPPVRYDDEED